MTFATKNRWFDAVKTLMFCTTVISLFSMLTGCGGPGYQELRRQGLRAMHDEQYALARTYFVKAEDKRPQRTKNLNDLGDCSLMLARHRFDEKNTAAAMREADRAISYFDRAITIAPGDPKALLGKNNALELKGRYDAALSTAQWAADNVGPSARQHVWLALEHEERGDYDVAFRRFRQAVVMEPKNVEAHIEFARFLLRRDNERAAIAHFQIAYKLDPTNREAADPLIERQALPPLTRVTQTQP